MAPASSKFGTFGGVFTPSILTILGVIMYMRLPWVVGHGGLWLTLGIIVAAHVISVSTGLSVSSIATDKKVEAGGAYYIVSRSMGLSMGGTLGIALFVGLSFSISLYIIGFSESFLDYFELGTDLQTIRICGTITLILLTIITFVSTSLAIRTQYFILAAIAASLLSIFTGRSAVPPEAPNLAPFEAGEAATVLFGIFFPAVTGFTAGVNMSGDLRDPKKSIPIGTMAAIAAGMLVYVSLAVFLALNVPGELLRNDSGALIDLASVPVLVVGGIWGATLSSALGSILGAPRILQALSLDNITPRVFGVGHGPTNEPRAALVLAFLIGEAGILIGELDAIARIVSVFFLATYGFLNLSASFEMIASPDFRPEFRIPRFVPVLGAVTCAVLMIWLDLAAMMGAVVVLGLLFLIIKRRELQLETGDALLGVWSSIVRQGLHRLASQTLHQRNWRPNILMFTHLDAESRRPLLDFSQFLIRQRGVANEIALTVDTAEGSAYAVVESDDPALEDDALDQLPGFFTRSVPVADGELYATMAAAVRFHGVNGLRHNTVMTDWHEHASDPIAFTEFLDLLQEEDLNVMCLAYEGELGFANYKRIDLWWSPRAGSLPLSLALTRFVTSSNEWKRAEVRFFIIADDASMMDTFHKTATQAFADARVNAVIKVIVNGVDSRSDDEWIRQYSATADLTVVGIPHDDLQPSDVQRLEDLGRAIGAVMLIRASSHFGNGFTSATAATLLREPTEETEAHRARMPDLRLPAPVALAQEAERFGDAHQRLASEAAESLLRPGLLARAALLETLQADIELQYMEFQAAFAGAGAFRRKRTFSRGSDALLRKVGGVLAEYETAEIARQQATAERGIERLMDALADLEAGVPRRLHVIRDAEDFDPNPDDPPHLRRFKTRRRLMARLRRHSPRYTLAPRGLARYHVRKATLEQTRAALDLTAAHCATLLEDVQRFLNVLKRSLDSLQRRFGADALDLDFVREERARVLDHLERLRTAQLEDTQAQLFGFVRAARVIQQQYADDLDRLDMHRMARRERRFRRADRAIAEQLAEIPARWAASQGLLMRRTSLAPLIASVQSQITAAVHRSARSVQAGIVEGVRASCAELGTRVAAFQAQVESGEVDDLRLQAVPSAEVFDTGPVVEGLRQSLQGSTSAVPEAQVMLREASLAAMVEHPFVDVETAEVAIRRQLQVLIDVELAAPIEEILAEIPRAEQRAKSVMEDVVRLITFNLSELGAASRDRGETSAMPAGAGPEGHADVQAILRPVVENGVERLQSELQRLDELAVTMARRIEAQLERVLDLTDGFAILGSVEGFESHGNRYGSGKLSGLSRVTERIRSEAGRALVNLAYRQSAGVLLARRMNESPTKSPVDGVLGLVDACTPRADVVEALPFYYRQLYLGQSGVHSAFWVGREAELDELQRAIARYDRGFLGPIVVTGEHGSGKTALLEVGVERFLGKRRVHRITPPSGGSCDPALFTEVLRRELRLSGSADAVLRSLPAGSVIVLYDLELWWERTPDGLAVLELLLQLVADHGDHCLFLIEIGKHALRMLEHFVPLSAEALAVVECGPVDAETLKEIVTLRHSSTGLSYVLDDRDEEELSEWARAQLFNAHFRRSEGNIGGALVSWVTGVRAFDGKRLTVEQLPALDDDAMSHVPPSCIGILVQLVLHQQLTPARLRRVTGESAVALDADLARLRRMGLIGRGRRDVVQIEPAASSLVHGSLRARRLLP
ncbi:MAG: hypothetical protein R3F61_12390 [Myxococcota bacterium]